MRSHELLFACVSLLILFFLLAVRAPTQNLLDKYKYRLRGEIYEGITKFQDIAEDNLSLISMRGIIEYNALKSRIGVEDSFKVGMLLSKSKNLKITAQTPIQSSMYKMFLDGKLFPQGYQTHAWPVKIADYYEIQPKSMFTVSEVKKRGGSQIIIPCVVFRDHFGGKIQGYELSFWARTPTDADIEIIKEVNGEIVWRQAAYGVTVGEPHSIEWDGRDLNGDRIEIGTYVMNVTATFRRGDGSTSAPRVYPYKFEHFWEFE
jgi:hypothetical protein